MDCVDGEALGAGHEGGAIEPLIITNRPLTAAPALAETLAAAVCNVVPLPARGRFGVIDGGRPARAEGVERPKMWLCATCETDIGVATSVVEPVWQGPLREAGRVRLSTGTKRIVCTHCKMRGKLTFAD
ncbi:MAG: hypothetical protein INF91_04490 [Alphaproteobacteria bacterium]|nr:hypothetical protein [Alphaproteobacteria bacterium]